MKDKSDDKKRQALKQSLLQLKLIMKNGIDDFYNKEEHKNNIKSNQLVINEIFQHFSNWRQFVFPGDEIEKLTKTQYQILNFPMFSENNPKEDDIFMFQGFIKPGNHKIYIYDPKSD